MEHRDSSLTEVRGSGLVCTHRRGPQDSFETALLSDLCGPSGIIEMMAMAGELQLPGRLVTCSFEARASDRGLTRALHGAFRSVRPVRGRWL